MSELMWWPISRYRRIAIFGTTIVVFAVLAGGEATAWEVANALAFLKALALGQLGG